MVFCALYYRTRIDLKDLKPIDVSLAITTITSQGGSESNGNDWVLHILQIPRTEVSLYEAVESHTQDNLFEGEESYLTVVDTVSIFYIPTTG